MLTRTIMLLVLVVFCARVSLQPVTALAQNLVADLPNELRIKAALEETDLAAFEQGQTVVKLLPGKDKREVAVCGLVRLQVPAETFLQSFRESMARKSNPAILEIGRFSGTPTPADLQSLTIEDHDIEDLKECAVGNCKIKLSAMMIERLHNEVDWEAQDYRFQATQLLKLILLDYVHDYLRRGDVALIEYSDKPKEIRLADEQRALMAASSFSADLHELQQLFKGPAKPETSLMEDVIVWSKIKFGLKPVIAINHIMIYKHDQKTGPQILVVSKQIYANHYFDSSLALTAFGSLPDAKQSYLFYENRSRVDGLEGPFGTIKRGIVENKAIDGLKAILKQSKLNLSARAPNQIESAPQNYAGLSWRRWTTRGAYLFLWLLLTTAFIALLALNNYNGNHGDADDSSPSKDDAIQ